MKCSLSSSIRPSIPCTSSRPPGPARVYICVCICVCYCPVCDGHRQLCGAIRARASASIPPQHHQHHCSEYNPAVPPKIQLECRRKVSSAGACRACFVCLREHACGLAAVRVCIGARACVCKHISSPTFYRSYPVHILTGISRGTGAHGYVACAKRSGKQDTWCTQHDAPIICARTACCCFFDEEALLANMIAWTQMRGEAEAAARSMHVRVSACKHVCARVYHANSCTRACAVWLWSASR